MKKIEFHRKELEQLRARLEDRRKSLYETTVRALMGRDKSKATVYVNEWMEMRKVTKVVRMSELALTQVMLRLESIHDVGDVMAHMTSAFKVLKSVSKDVQGLVPALDSASQEINSTLAETMSQMGNVSPSIEIDLKTESGEELVEQARRYAEEQAESMKRQLMSTPHFGVPEAETEERVPLLATGEDGEEGSILGTLYTSTKAPETEDQVLKYASTHNGTMDVTDAAKALSIPPDDIEHAMLKLVSEGRVKLVSAGGAEK
jgi:division protein CdvB (Snf7/Vps24/ESCRT-III family)